MSTIAVYSYCMRRWRAWTCPSFIALSASLIFLNSFLFVYSPFFYFVVWLRKENHFFVAICPSHSGCLCLACLPVFFYHECDDSPPLCVCRIHNVRMIFPFRIVYNPFNFSVLAFSKSTYFVIFLSFLRMTTRARARRKGGAKKVT